ncbi:MAG: MFS transporter [Dehalococcoidia bacterium]
MERPTSALVRVVPFFYGWWVVISTGAIIFVATGAYFYGFSTLVDPFEEEFGWSRALIGGAFSAAVAAEGLASPVVGYLADRFSASRLLMAGVLLVGGGFVVLGQIQAVWQLYAAMVIIAVGTTLIGLVSWVTIAHWFAKKRGRALALATGVVGTCGVMVMVLAALISFFGWRSAVVMIGISQVAICIPLALTVRRRPEDVGLLPDGEGHAPDQSLARPGASPKGESAADRKVEHEGLTVRQALGTRPFWLLTFASALAWLGGMALIGHLVAFLEESADFSRGEASAVAMGIPLASLVGRLGFGWLADYVVKRRLLAVAYVLQGAGILIFATTDSPWQAVLFLVVFSVGWGGTIPVLPALEAEYFGLRAFGGIQGLLSGLATLGAFVGPVFAGVVYDVTDSYRPAFLLMTFTTMAAVPAILMMGRVPAWAKEAASAPMA